MEKWWERYRWILFTILIAAPITVLLLYQLLRPEPAPIQLSTPTPQPSPYPTPTPGPLRVYVSGAVREPDVYLLQPESIVKDAVAAAGGATEAADLNHINLAMPVADGQQIHVPSQGEEPLPVQVPSGQRSTTIKVNLNTADLAVLDSLPGIGPVLAQRVLDYRQAHGPFERIGDITKVSGIGPAIFEDIQDLITTE